MSGPMLLDTSWAPVTTHRVSRPRVLWTNPDAAAVFDPEQVYCSPVAGEAAQAYASGTRTEWADRYGGAGIGASGGSGRCATFGGVQCKGVGVTPLVAADADAFHGSGTLGHIEAASEILYSQVYRRCLPFGAVPVLALVATGTRCAPRHEYEAGSPAPLRSLLYRPFVPRPAHFMRNARHAEAGRPCGDAPGWTQDALRTRQAMAGLAAYLHAELQLTEPAHDELACLDAGLRELARRLAWQAAAAFSKRMPHGSFSASNVALGGAYLDCGLVSFIPDYRRHGWLAWSDPWEELNAPLPTLVTLRKQLDKYHPACAGSSVITAQDLASVYQDALNGRLRIEFARMAGLTEDLAAACPPLLLDRLLGAMLEIARRGAGDRHVPFSGCMADGGPTPAAPPSPYRLNAALAALWVSNAPHDQDAGLAPVLPDADLRARLVRGAADVRAALAAQDPAAALGAMTAYFARQALRKNGQLESLHREAFARQCASELAGTDDLADRLQSMLDRHVAQACYVLDDLDPELPGATGRAQIVVLAAKPQPTEQRLAI